MRGPNKPLSHAHLHAYADQELTDPRRADVSKFVKTHPKLVIRIRDYQFINACLHQLYDGVLSEPIPNRLINMVKKYRTNNRIMSLILLGMLLGGVIGIVAHQPQSREIVTWAREWLEVLLSRL